jgi:PAS domain S-box-containing protein
MHIHPASKPAKAVETAMPEFPSSPASAREGPPRPSWLYILVFAAGSLLIVALTGFHLLERKKASLAYWQDQQFTIVDDRARLISNWLGERRADGELLALYPSVPGLLGAVPGANSSAGFAAAEPLSAFLDQFALTQRYAAIYLINAQGAVVARSAASESIPPAVSEKARQVSHAHAFWVGPLGEGPANSDFYFLYPVFAPSRGGAANSASAPCLGVFAFQIDPGRSLFPILMVESAATRSGETFLVRREGDELIYFTPLRGEPLPGGFLRRSLSTEVGKASWEDRLLNGERLDYRGVPVLSALRRIPLTDWIVVRKLDRTEALEDFYSSARLELAVGACAVLIFAYLMIGYRRKRLARALEERLAQQQAILALQAFAQEMVDNVPVGLLILSPDLNVLSANRTFLEQFHTGSGEVVGRPVAEVVQPKGPPRRNVGDEGQGEGTHDVLLDLAQPGTAGKPTRLMLTQISSREGKGRLLLTIEDQTESERLRAAAEASESRLRELVQGIDAIVWEAESLSNRFTFVSRRAEQMLGYPVEQWLTQPDFWYEHLDPLDRAAAGEARRQAVSEGRDHSLDYRFLTADGAVVWLHDTTHVVLDAGGHPAQLRGVALDSTKWKRAEAERERLEQQLRQAQKMEAVGRLAGGVAHDFNNVLTIINGYTGLLLDHPAAVEPLRGYVEMIQNASGRAASLTRQLLAFSRQQVLAPRVVDLNGVAANIEKMLRLLTSEDVELVLSLADGLWPVKADPGQLEQVLLNLAVNARDAMPKGGVLTIRTANFSRESSPPQDHFPLPPGRYVLLSVTDTGIGMDVDTQARIFEPFFTTKEMGKGTGLGLAMVYGIVQQSGGYIGVDSELGKGTTFRIYLPHSPEKAVEQSPPRPAAETRSGTETILLVEDEDAVRALLRSVLESRGYSVLEASRGDEALELSQAYGGEIDLLVTDVVMPQMGGPQLARRLTSSRPHVKVLYISGYADQAAWYQNGLESGDAFLQKPFPPEALARKVREVLGAPEPQ